MNSVSKEKNENSGSGRGWTGVGTGGGQRAAARRRAAGRRGVEVKTAVNSVYVEIELRVRNSGCEKNGVKEVTVSALSPLGAWCLYTLGLSMATRQPL